MFVAMPQIQSQSSWAKDKRGTGVALNLEKTTAIDQSQCTYRRKIAPLLQHLLPPHHIHTHVHVPFPACAVESAGQESWYTSGAG